MPTPRTSITDPLQICTLRLPAAPGRIGITFCPGKQDGSGFGAGWMRDLALDLQALREWGATAVLTLIEAHEFDLLGVPQLGQAVCDAGMAWHHAPIVDLGKPDAVFMAGWAMLASRLVERMQRGEGVAVHCRGGLGRAGTVAAMLAIELGQTPGAALRAVRAVRPGTVETATQERFVLAYRRRLGAPHLHSKGGRAQAQAVARACIAGCTLP